jgi:hypothetical protein
MPLETQEAGKSEILVDVIDRSVAEIRGHKIRRYKQAINDCVDVAVGCQRAFGDDISFWRRRYRILSSS